MTKFLSFFLNLPKQAAIIIIDSYQLLLSPDHSWLKAKYPYGYCRHYPSCSEYAKQALQRRGFVKGLWLSVKRLSKCHPWAEPKVDLIPNS